MTEAQSNKERTTLLITAAVCFLVGILAAVGHFLNPTPYSLFPAIMQLTPSQETLLITVTVGIAFLFGGWALGLTLKR